MVATVVVVMVVVMVFVIVVKTVVTVSKPIAVSQMSVQVGVQTVTAVVVLSSLKKQLLQKQLKPLQLQLKPDIGFVQTA
jgi:hypothetical protein